MPGGAGGAASTPCPCAVPAALRVGAAPCAGCRGQRPGPAALPGSSQPRRVQTRQETPKPLGYLGVHFLVSSKTPQGGRRERDAPSLCRRDPAMPPPVSTWPAAGGKSPGGDGDTEAGVRLVTALPMEGGPGGVPDAQPGPLPTPGRSPAMAPVLGAATFALPAVLIIILLFLLGTAAFSHKSGQLPALGRH